MADSAVGYGVDAMTGARLAGWDHVVQSLRDIFTTRFGERIMREYFGSFVPEALGRNITANEILPVIASITSAIEQYEPRFFVVSVNIGGQVRAGELNLTITGRYRPRALFGDLAEEGTKTLAINAYGGGIALA